MPHRPSSRLACLVAASALTATLAACGSDDGKAEPGAAGLPSPSGATAAVQQPAPDLPTAPLPSAAGSLPAAQGEVPTTPVQQAAEQPTGAKTSAPVATDGTNGTAPATDGSAAPATTGSTASPTDASPTGASPTGASPTDVGPAGAGARTRCTKLIHIGESTSMGLTSKTYLPNPADRIDARYRGVGVQDFTADIYGARSIVENHPAAPTNVQTAVKQHQGSGFDGCYVVAMGTNDPANQHAGGSVPEGRRIDLVMQGIGKDQPVLWTATKTLDSAPAIGKHYHNDNMRRWNRALAQACTRYPNMRVFDWPAEVQDSWFINDGIHYGSKGYQERAARFAKALAVAFPAQGSSPQQCFVTSTGQTSGASANR